MPRRATIIVADADDRIRRLLEEFLGEDPPTLLHVPSLSRALETLDERDADLLVADSRLPVVEGGRLLRSAQ
jgi:DNA-binding response OmpR family regulator